MDILKDYLVHGAQTLQAASVRLILELSSIIGFKVWSIDVKMVHLQCASALGREI